MTKTLYLPLTGYWFKKILSGEKKTDFREIKSFWIPRLEGRTYDDILCRIGYGGKSPTAIFKFDRIDVVPGMESDLKVDRPVYAVRLGELIEKINCEGLQEGKL